MLFWKTKICFISLSWHSWLSQWTLEPQTISRSVSYLEAMHRNTRFLGSENMVKLSIMLARKARICREGFGQQIGHTHGSFMAKIFIRSFWMARQLQYTCKWRYMALARKLWHQEGFSGRKKSACLQLMERSECLKMACQLQKWRRGEGAKEAKKQLFSPTGCDNHC